MGIDMNIDDILNAVVDEGAMIVRPATEKDLKLCQKDMAEMEFPSIPQGYAGFLSKLNGFAWNGIEFFSTDQVTDTETGYTLNDIVSANEMFVKYNEGYKHCVFLGRADDDLYVYNSIQNVVDVHINFHACFYLLLAAPHERHN